MEPWQVFDELHSISQQICFLRCSIRQQFEITDGCQAGLVALMKSVESRVLEVRESLTPYASIIVQTEMKKGQP